MIQPAASSLLAPSPARSSPQPVGGGAAFALPPASGEAAPLAGSPAEGNRHDDAAAGKLLPIELAPAPGLSQTATLPPVASPTPAPVEAAAIPASSPVELRSPKFDLPTSTASLSQRSLESPQVERTIDLEQLSSDRRRSRVPADTGTEIHDRDTSGLQLPPSQEHGSDPSHSAAGDTLDGVDGSPRSDRDAMATIVPQPGAAIPIPPALIAPTTNPFPATSQQLPSAAAVGTAQPIVPGSALATSSPTSLPYRSVDADAEPSHPAEQATNADPLSRAPSSQASSPATIPAAADDVAVDAATLLPLSTVAATPTRTTPWAGWHRTAQPVVAPEATVIPVAPIASPPTTPVDRSLVAILPPPAAPVDATISNRSVEPRQDAPTVAPLPSPLPRLAQPTAPAPAAVVFGAARFAAQIADDHDEPAAPLAIASLAAPATIERAGATVVPSAPLDLRQERWPHAMIERIEMIRDAADAVDTRIRLVPDALGAIDVEVQRDGDALHVRFHAEQPQTRALLAEAAPRLAEAAESRGLRLGQTSVGNGDGSAGRDQPRQPLPSAPPRARLSAADGTDDADGDTRLA